MNALRNILCFFVLSFIQIVCAVNLKDFKVIRVGSAPHLKYDKGRGSENRVGSAPHLKDDEGRGSENNDLKADDFKAYGYALQKIGLDPKNVLHISDWEEAYTDHATEQWYKHVKYKITGDENEHHKLMNLFEGIYSEDDSIRKNAALGKVGEKEVDQGEFMRGKVDLIITDYSVSSFLNLKPEETYFTRLADLLKPGGKAIFTCTKFTPGSTYNLVKERQEYKGCGQDVTFTANKYSDWEDYCSKNNESQTLEVENSLYELGYGFTYINCNGITTKADAIDIIVLTRTS
ncbi:MAG: hypothetical protein LBB21_05965 [Holosporaceae bacterium]|nr:hypothetical protein [Holosporaceae bacterium]